MADQQKQSGFKLPIPSGHETASPDAVQKTDTSQAMSQGIPTIADTDTSQRDMVIAGGILLVLVIAFFFAKTAYANALVAKKIAPRSANAAGWWLFILLTCMAVAGVLGFINQAKFLTPYFMAPLGLVSLVSLILMLISGRR